jgi:hypothetical protein
MISGGKRWRAKEIVCIPTGYTEDPFEVRAVNVTMPFPDTALKFLIPSEKFPVIPFYFPVFLSREFARISSQ